MDWFFLTITAYFILALVGIADKFLLSKIVPDSRIYAFLVGVLGLLVFLFAPFGLSWPGIMGFILDIIAGVASIIALMLFYRALKKGEASVVIPLIGGGVPILVFIFSSIFLGEYFTSATLVAVLFLLLGGVLITLIPKEKPPWWQFWRPRHTSGNWIAFWSALSFAVFFVLSKHLYNTQGFMNGFIWARIGAFAVAMIMLFDLKFRRMLFRFIKDFGGGRKYLILINQFFGSIGFAALSYAISLYHVSVVNALQGVQYVFVLALASLVSLKWPKLIQERITKKIIVEKIVAILFIGIGLYIIAYYK